VLAAPRDEQELRRLLRTAFGQEHPFAIQYPRDPGLDLPEREPSPVEVGRGELLREGRDILVVGLGPIISRGLAVADELEAAGWKVGVIDARFARPLDADLIQRAAAGVQLVVTLEESALPGGFGSAVLEVLAEGAAALPPVRRIGIPAGRFVDHGSVADLRRLIGLDVPGIRAQVEEAIAELAIGPSQPPGDPAGRDAMTLAGLEADARDAPLGAHRA
jgi:1-deoxy-D-xylulose-5-phosphate synthase